MPGLYQLYRVSDERPELAGLGKIAFTKNGSLWIVQAEGGQAINLGSVRQPAAFSWSPDSSQLAGVRSKQVWIVNADGSGGRILLPDRHFYCDVAWSPDGTRIAYAIWPEADQGVYGYQC
jgi:hypothetical protein